jgi:hypothetical protein
MLELISNMLGHKKSTCHALIRGNPLNQGAVGPTASAYIMAM